VCKEFSINLSELEGCEILYASYSYENYSGDTEVLFVKNGILYEVVGGHCSCNGLEDQWEPEETSVVALLSRPNITDNAKKNLKEYYKNMLCFL
jgi:hypothetical protein